MQIHGAFATTRQSTSPQMRFEMHFPNQLNGCEVKFNFDPLDLWT